MRFLILFVIFCSAFGRQGAVCQNEDADDLKDSIRKLPTANDIKEMIEKLRDEWKPKLNDYEFQEKKFSFHDEDLKLTVNIEASGAVKGLLDFSVDLTGLLTTYKFDVHWPKTIEVVIRPYDLQGYIHLIQIFGYGELRTTIQNIKVKGSIMILPHGKPVDSVIIKKFNLQKISFEEPKFSLTGWLNDEIRSKIISDLIENNIQSIMEKYDAEIRTAVNQLVLKLTANLVIPLPSSGYQD